MLTQSQVVAARLDAQEVSIGLAQLEVLVDFDDGAWTTQSRLIERDMRRHFEGLAAALGYRIEAMSPARAPILAKVVALLVTA